MATSLFAEPLSPHYPLQSPVINDRHDGGALFKVLTALCAGRSFPGDDELMEKVSLGHREPDGETTSMVRKAYRVP